MNEKVDLLAAVHYFHNDRQKHAITSDSSDSVVQGEEQDSDDVSKLIIASFDHYE